MFEQSNNKILTPGVIVTEMMHSMLIISHQGRKDRYFQEIVFQYIPSYFPQELGYEPFQKIQPGIIDTHSVSINMLKDTVNGLIINF